MDIPNQLESMNRHSRILPKGCFALLMVLLLVGVQRVQAIDILVTTNADSGNGTLRQAIQFNESLGGGNTILFSNVTGAIVFTNALGEPVITKDVNILGPGASVLSLAVATSSERRVLHVVSGSVNLSDLTITGGNSTQPTNGAGIVQDSGSLTLSNCVVSRNVTLNGNGGGVYANGSLTVVNCLFSGNTGLGSVGGGIYAAGLLTAGNSTFIGNFSHYGGGAIFQSGGALAMTNCTIAGNRSGDGGGGIGVSGATATIRNTIIANNKVDISGPDCFGTFTSVGYNFIGAINGSSGWGAIGDQVGTTNSPLDPLLGPLQDNGGPTLTMAPMTGSPVIDQGNSGGVFVDQRGQFRPFTNSSIGSIPLGGDRGDIGAVEFHPGDDKIMVGNNNDSGVGSLRSAIQVATAGMHITFASNLIGTIVLTSGELLINKALTISGPTNSVEIVSGDSSLRVFHITGGPVNISGLTIADGNSSAPGAGLFCDFGGTLVLSNCAVFANTTTSSGGGIANNGSVAAYNCTFSSNHAGDGGGIYTYAGPVLLRNCTVVSNSATGSGGGLFNYSLVAGTSNNISGTLVANNSAPDHADVIGVFKSSGYNLIGKMDYNLGSGNGAGVATSGLTNGVNHDQAGSLALPIDPLVGALQNNGGPTFTHAVKPGSPAIDKGVSNGLTTDQRGAPRLFDFASVANASGGDGSDIGAFESGTPQLSVQAIGTNVIVSWPAYYGGFKLEVVTNLPASNNWVSIPGILISDGNQYNVTNGPVSGNKFYRLREF
jgi:hypothetical protein